MDENEETTLMLTLSSLFIAIASASLLWYMFDISEGLRQREPYTRNCEREEVRRYTTLQYHEEMEEHPPKY